MHSRSRRRTLLVTAVIAAVVALGAFWLVGTPGGADTHSAVTDVGPEAFMAALRADPQAVLVDVRTPQEFAAGHLPGAVNVELDRLEAMAPTTLPDRNAHLLVYCHSGNRSSFAVQILERMGYTRLVNLVGGIAAWSSGGYPVTRD